MSTLICFPNKLEKPGSGVHSEFAFAGDGSKPAEDGAAGEGVAFMGASCSPDPGNEAGGECGKRLSDSLWASEDLSCSSEIRQDAQASPERTGAADSHRAISLDASECLTEMTNQALVRSTALEDLTSIGDRSSWVNQGEEVIAEQAKNGVPAEGTDSGNQNICPETQQPLFSQNQSHSLFDCHSEDLQPAHNWRNDSEKDSLLTKKPSGMVSENSSSDSSLHTASYSKPDISDDSDTRSNVVQTTGTAELQKTTSQSSPARKSLVPVPVFKGLFAVMLTSSESSSVNSFHFFHLQRSFYCVLCCTLPPNPFSGSYNLRRSLLSSLPTFAFGFFAPSLLTVLVMPPPKATLFSCFFSPRAPCVAVHAILLTSPRFHFVSFAMRMCYFTWADIKEEL